MSAVAPRAAVERTSWQVRFVPCVDGSGLARGIFTSQAWSVLPCVRPFGAVHMTAGHNALRGSGPGQNRAFNDAMAQVGCPDRRIDRLCITCCSPSQPSHHAAFRRDLADSRPRRTRWSLSASGSLSGLPKALLQNAPKPRLHRSISPNTISSDPMIAETSANMWPHVRKSMAERWAKEGARILHLYGRLVPSETR